MYAVPQHVPLWYGVHVHATECCGTECGWRANSYAHQQQQNVRTFCCMFAKTPQYFHLNISVGMDATAPDESWTETFIVQQQSEAVCIINTIVTEQNLNMYDVQEHSVQTVWLCNESYCCMLTSNPASHQSTAPSPCQTCQPGMQLAGLTWATSTVTWCVVCVASSPNERASSSRAWLPTVQHDHHHFKYTTKKRAHYRLAKHIQQAIHNGAVSFEKDVQGHLQPWPPGVLGYSHVSLCSVHVDL